jgi:hypothetical protein
MNSRVHPKYKTKYRVQNWQDYDRGLVSRGDITVWLFPGAIAAWRLKRTGRPRLTGCLDIIAVEGDTEEWWEWARRQAAAE